MSRRVPVIPHLIDRHVGDAGFYWAQIEDSAHSPLVDPDGLADLERLLGAHLDGLRVAGDAGWEAASAALQRWGTAEEMYVCVRLALESDRARERLRAVWPSAPAASADARLMLQLPVRIGLEYALHRGDPALLPWVVAQMEDPDAARLAGWVWSSLTGIDLERHGLALEPREPDPEREPPPTDEQDPGLPLPDAAALSAFRPRLPGTAPILLGEPLRGEHTMAILERAPQALRWIAARRRFGTGFDVRAPLAQQRALLGAQVPLGSPPAPGPVAA